MIIFINGSFGSGKTTVANLLLNALPNSLLFDAEEVGFMLSAILTPIDSPGDFQHYPAWRALVPKVADQLLREYNRTLIMPMTIWRQDYFEEITEGLKAIEPDLRHFCLMASLETLNERLRKRGHPDGDWVFDQTPKCVAAFESGTFETKVDTGFQTPERVAESILESVGQPP